MGVLMAIFNTLVILTSIFLVCLILIQRGKGGGLAGAFGGQGGSSAFGTKAGDTFTKITVATAAVWMLLLMMLVVMTNRKTVMAFEPESSISDTSASKAKSKATSGDAPTTTTPAAAEKTDAVPALPADSQFPAAPETPAPKTP